MTIPVDRGKRIAVAMSGGVDSSVTALLLKEHGFDVVGVTMKLWKKSDDAVDAAVEDAQKVADHIGISHLTFDLTESFYTTIVEPFCKEYIAGRTPNPCIVCNRLIKFGALFDVIKEKCATDLIATGHYARIEYNGSPRLRKGIDPAKDQSYFLSRLTLEQLARSVMPLGEYTKKEILDIAVAKRLPVAHRPESQEICFLPDGGYADFVMNAGGDTCTPGPIVDVHGKKLGEHHGLPHYTIGQRKNLGVALGKPQYVLEINPETNTIVIGDNHGLFHRGVRSKHLNCLYSDGFPTDTPLKARVRYRHREQPGYIQCVHDDSLVFIFNEPQRAITPGQQLVIYDGEYIVGSGFIDRAFD